MRATRGPRRRRDASGAVALLLCVGLAGAACQADGEEPRPAPTPAPSVSPTRLTFAVWGADEEVEAFDAVTAAYNEASDIGEVSLRSWPDHAGLREALQGDAALPDVFMISREDLVWLREDDLNQPVDLLLDERGVDFGDGYSRDALQAFAVDNRLQCMPYGVSPTVVFYNRDLVDFERMRARELPAPEDEEDLRWSLEEFAAAADFATRPRLGTRGVHVEPTLRGLAPFVYSGGGDLFDDEDEPTSLALSSEDSRSALERTLEVLRDPRLTLTDEQLQRASALEWFERGKLAMIAGQRSLVPWLRAVPGLDFDVMPMPVLDSEATVGDVTGLCLSRDSGTVPESADFLVHATSAESVAQVAAAGYLAPANLEVAASEDFLQPGRRPTHATVFNDSVRAMQFPPLLDVWPQLETMVAGDLRELVSIPVLDDLDVRTQVIDEKSRSLLDPQAPVSDPPPGD